MDLDCNNIIDSQWCIGGSFYAEERTFVRNTLILPVLNIAIDADRDIEGWSINAYFKDPNFKEGDVAIVWKMERRDFIRWFKRRERGFY